MALIPGVLTCLVAPAGAEQGGAGGAACSPSPTAAAGFSECSQAFSSLGRREVFSFKPPAPGRRSAIVLLHGAGRDHRTLLQDPVTRAALERTPSAVILPRGGMSWWVDTPGSAYESCVLELMDRMADALHIPKEPARWAVAGWSMGGFGSLRLIERHPERFRAWGGLLALSDFPNPGYPPERNHAVPKLFGPPDTWAAWNPLAEAAKLRGKKVWFATGDKAFDRGMNEALDRRLRELAIPHEMHIVPGGHEFRVVAATLGRLLEYLDHDD